MVLRPSVGHILLTHEVSRSHSHTPQSVGLLCTSDQPVAETSTCTRQTCLHRNSKLLSQQASGRRPRGHWNGLDSELRC